MGSNHRHRLGAPPRGARYQPQLLLSMVVASCSVACTAYDAALLPEVTCGDGRLQDDESCDIAIAPWRPGGCPEECSSDGCSTRELVGTGCQQRCVTTTITAALDDDGCCPSHALAASEDSDCGRCGDSVIGPGEACDPPDTCPAEDSCVSTQSCTLFVYSGSPETCDARCEVQHIDTCKADDDCCPSSCDSSLDTDCSDRCGNGVVDTDAGETCDDGAADTACPEHCDDGDTCTRDLKVGSAENCNVTCSHTEIEATDQSDGCCALAAAPGEDPDCNDACGSEPGGGTTGCTTNSAAASPGTPGSRYEACKAATDPDTSRFDFACSECACRSCANDVLQCYASADGDRDATCIPAFECTLRTECASHNACYCGTSLPCRIGTGPCADEFEAAASSPNAASVEACNVDLDCAISRARHLRECLRTSCFAACYL